MKRIIGTIILFFASLIAAATAYFQAHPAVMWIAIMLLSCAVFLGLAKLFQLTAKFLSNTATALIFMGCFVILLGTLSWFRVIPVFAAFSAGLGLGLILAVLCVRKVGLAANNSSMLRHIFHALTGYNPPVYFAKGDAVDKEYRDLTDTLKKKPLKFTDTEAQEAAMYALKTVPAEAPIEDKIIAAIQYLGKDKPNEEVD